MNVKTHFSIKDLENLSGIKAHTIRIWEKRYNLLDPNRTKTNIRKYDIDNLKKILNVAFLYNEGYKISKIADLESSQITELINNQTENKQKDFSLNSFKTAMLSFDSSLFSKTYNELEQHYSFRDIFFKVFIPFLTEIGVLWQTGTIDPAHEHFVSELIKQKIILNIEQVQPNHTPQKDVLFSLFLPYKEIHDIGLLYAHYEVLNAGFKTIYLGANIPLESLKYVLRHHDNIIFLSYLTIKPEKQTFDAYIQSFTENVCTHKSCDLWLIGNKTEEIQSDKTPSHIKLFPSLKEFILEVEKLKKS